MEYKVKINEFEGPLDLLLHLIKNSDINIMELNIEKITQQYFDYIKAMKDLNLDVASEYLIMAAELIEIKSSLLLPKPKLEDDEYEENPREKLVKRLLEYKKYKELTGTFSDLEHERKQIYSKIPSSLKEFETESTPDFGEVSMDDLMNAFSNLLLRKIEERPLNTKVTKKEYSVSVRSFEIKALLKEKKKIAFEDLFQIFTKKYVVVTFLSILELSKNGDIIIKQEDNFSNIFLSLKGSEDND